MKEKGNSVVALSWVIIYIPYVKALHQTYQQSTKAPELYGDYWFNSAPRSIASSHGQNILLFFWSYTSPASLRMLPIIQEWFTMYADLGLECIGVHSPEFSFATNPRNVEDFLQKHSVHFPIVADNDRLIAGAYRITTFPSLVLISGNGNIYDIITETFSISRLERSIQYLLRQSGFFGELPMLRSIESERTQEHNAFEITTGYLHGSLGNVEGYSPELPSEYRDPNIYVEGKFYAHGIWRAERNAFHYEGEPNEGYLICQSEGENVDALVGSEQKNSLRIKVDDATMLIEQMGSDVQRDPKGNSIVLVNEPQFVSIYRGAPNEKHSVKLIPSNPGITFYLFSLYKEHISGDIDQTIHTN